MIHTPHLTRRRLLACAAAAIPLSSWAAWPERNLRWVVPYAAGGGADTAARVIGQRVAELLGQPVVIDNKPGAGGMLGADLVAKAPADGYTVLFDASAFAVNGALRKLPYDPLTDFIPVSLAVSAPQILVVSPQSRFKTLADLVAAAKAAPGKLTFASAGAGTGSHLAAELMNDQASIDLLPVPYKGGAPALTDGMAGSVDCYFGNAASTQQHVTGGKLHALAVSSRTRLKALPDMPTLAQSGMPEFEVLEWNGAFLPKATPNEVVARFAKAFRDAMEDPKVRDRLSQGGVTPVGTSPAEFAQFVERESKRWQALVKARKITVD